MLIRPLRSLIAIASIAAISCLAGAPIYAQSAPPVHGASPDAAQASPGADDVEDIAVTARAKDALHRVQTGTLDRTQLTDEYNQVLTDDTLADARTQLSPLGEPATFVYEAKVARGDVTAYVYRVTFAQGAGIDEMIAIDSANKIVRLLFGLRPSITPSPARPPART